MDIFQSAAGQVTVAVTSADIPGMLRQMNQAQIMIFDMSSTEPMTVVLTIWRKDYKRLGQIVRRRGERLKRIRNQGIYWTAKGLLRRPILMIGCMLILVLSLILPSRVLFVRVEGNAEIPTRYIVEAAERCGIGFGASRREVRSERMKNMLLDHIPQLQWAGVNTYGCVAVISVRERTEPPATVQTHQVSSIVAQRDGVVQSCTVTRGTAMCTVGQAVTKGQILISGFTDCGLCIQADRAEGEILALTNRSLNVLTPENGAVRVSKQQSTKKISLIVGKFRINFYKDSGILDSTCVKMYSENYMTLPGGFRLPVALAVEERISCHIGQSAQKDYSQTLMDFAQRYLQSQMTAGQILRREEQIDGCQLEGQYACLEMIGQVRYEESITENENH
jgi:sporulation protein YqfD